MNEQLELAELLFALLRSTLRDLPLEPSAAEGITPEVLPKIYKLAKRHDLAHLLADPLQREGLLPSGSDAERILSKERMVALFRYEQQNYELNAVCAALEEAKIPHVPLKGSVIRSLYPAPWMRTGCDIDILVRPADLETAIALLCDRLGFTHEVTKTHDAQLWAPDGVHLELHFDLIEEDYGRECTAILSTVWDHVTPVEGYRYRSEFSDDYFYFYHIAHMAKHLEEGGCGIRPFIDLWIIEEKLPPNKSPRISLLKKGGLQVFAEVAAELSYVWMSGTEGSSLCNDTAEYVLCGGVYGSRDNSLAAASGKKGSRIKYLFYRIFLPYEELCSRYPRLRGRRILYPFYAILRLFRFLKKGQAKRSADELSYLESDRAKGIGRLMRQLELTK